MIDTTKFYLLCSGRGQRDLAQLSIPPGVIGLYVAKKERKSFPIFCVVLAGSEADAVPLTTIFNA